MQYRGYGAVDEPSIVGGVLGIHATPPAEPLPAVPLKSAFSTVVSA